MKATDINYEFLKIRIDRIADARGIIFSEKIKFIETALASMQSGEILKIYCSDHQHKAVIPRWIKNNGHHFLSIIDESNYFKILIQKS